MNLYSEAVNRIDGVRAAKVKLLKEIEEKIEKGNFSLILQQRKKQLKTFWLNLMFSLICLEKKQVMRMK